MAATAATVLLLGLTACGDGDKEAVTPKADDGGLAGTPVKIGLAIPTTGGRADAMKAVKSVSIAWANDVNKNGGIGGRPVEIHAVDTKNDPAETQTVVKELVEDEQVVALMIGDTTTESVVGDYLNEQNVPVIGGEGYNTELWSALPNFFSLHTTIPQTLQVQATVASALEKTNFAAITCNSHASCTQAEAIYEPAAEANGLTWDGIVPVGNDAPSYTAECVSLMERGVDFMHLSLIGTTGSRVIADCAQQGYDDYYGVVAGGFEQWMYEGTDGAKIAGGLHGFPWWADAEPAQHFRDVIEEAAPGTEYRTPTITAFWSTLELFKKALGEAEGDVTREMVFEAYAGLEGETLDGLLAQPLTFEAGQPAPKVNCFWGYDYEVGNDNPELLTIGDSGNGATGDLQSSCLPAAE